MTLQRQNSFLIDSELNSRIFRNVGYMYMGFVFTCCFVDLEWSPLFCKKTYIYSWNTAHPSGTEIIWTMSSELLTIEHFYLSSGRRIYLIPCNMTLPVDPCCDLGIWPCSKWNEINLNPDHIFFCNIDDGDTQLIWIISSDVWLVCIAFIFDIHNPCNKSFRTVPCCNLDLWPSSSSDFRNLWHFSWIINYFISFIFMTYIPTALGTFTFVPCVDLNLWLIWRSPQETTIRLNGSKYNCVRRSILFDTIGQGKVALSQIVDSGDILLIFITIIMY